MGERGGRVEGIEGWGGGGGRGGREGGWVRLRGGGLHVKGVKELGVLGF